MLTPKLCYYVSDSTTLIAYEIENKYKCRKCDNSYDKKEDLVEHVQFHSKHSQLLKCPICPHHSSNNQKSAIKHLEESHNMVFETETIIFATFEEFNFWKKEKELETSSCFVSSHGSYKTNEFVRFKYLCHRSGSIRRQGKGIRRMKTSKKIDAFCPSRLEVTVRADKCEVIFVKTHVGHDCDVWLVSMVMFNPDEILQNICPSSHYAALQWLNLCFYGALYIYINKIL